MTALLRALTFGVVLILSGLPVTGYGQKLLPIPKDEALFNDSDYEIGPGWRLATRSSKDSNGQQDLFYYDRARVTRLADGYRAWLKRARQQDGKLLSEEMALQDYDCERKQMRILQSFVYDPDGNQVEDLGPADWHVVIPDSITEYVFNIFCRGERDTQWRDIVAAQHYFSWGVRAEKKKQYRSAVHWYGVALAYAPDHPKILAAIKRMTAHGLPNPAFDALFAEEPPSASGVSPEVSEMAEIGRKALPSPPPKSKRKTARRKTH